jgi:hypothetical protein
VNTPLRFVLSGDEGNTQIEEDEAARWGRASTDDIPSSCGRPCAAALGNNLILDFDCVLPHDFDGLVAQRIKILEGWPVPYGPRHGVSRGTQRGTFARYTSYSAPNVPCSVGSSYATTNRWKASQNTAPNRTSPQAPNNKA